MLLSSMQGRKCCNISSKYCVSKGIENIVYRRVSTILCIKGYRRYCVSKGIDDISWRNIGPTIFQDKSREIGYISRYIDNFGDKSAIFPDISHGQRRSTEVKHATVKSMCYNAATMRLPFCFRGDLNPKLAI